MSSFEHNLDSNVTITIWHKIFGRRNWICAHRPWTYGLLFNHLWSVASTSSRPDLSTTFLQPFLSYTTKDAWTFTLQTETTYDWKGEQWTVPVNALVSKVAKVGDQLVSFGAGARYWAEGPQSAPHGWGLRFLVTLLFPR